MVAGAGKAHSHWWGRGSGSQSSIHPHQHAQRQCRRKFNTNFENRWCMENGRVKVATSIIYATRVRSLIRTDVYVSRAICVAVHAGSLNNARLAIRDPTPCRNAHQVTPKPVASRSKEWEILIMVTRVKLYLRGREMPSIEANHIIHSL